MSFPGFLLARRKLSSLSARDAAKLLMLRSPSYRAFLSLKPPLTRQFWCRDRKCTQQWNLNKTRLFSSTQTCRNPVYVRFEDDQSQRQSKRPQGRDAGIRLAIGVAALGTIYYVAHLEQVPETGRWRFMNTSHKFEAKIGELARQQAREEYKDMTLPPNHPLSRHVRRVASRILAASNLGTIRDDYSDSYTSPFSRANGGLSLETMEDAGAAGQRDIWNPDDAYGSPSKPPSGPGAIEAGVSREWDVMVVHDPKMVNAQVVPGLIIVYTGILPICQDEQGLASVLSHEIGHAVARHTAERISSQTIVIGLMIILQALGLDFGVSDLIQQLLFQLPNSRTQELEADNIGLKLMSRACFDPKAAPEMLSRLAKIEAKIPSRVSWDFFRTHPSSMSRVQKLEQLLPEGYAIIAANPECAAMQDQVQLFKQAAERMYGGGPTFWQ